MTFTRSSWFGTFELMLVEASRRIITINHVSPLLLEECMIEL